jgi:hypothetical protein
MEIKMNDESILETVNKITEINDLSEFLNDEEFDKAMELVIKLIVKPGIDPAAAQRLIVKLQALSTKYAVLAVTYSTIKRDKAGTPNNYKKNIYHILKEALDKLCDALKYPAKLGL